MIREYSALSLTLTAVLFSPFLNERAIAISYDESVDGDLPSTPEGSPVLPLDYGANTVTGVTTFDYESLDAFDSFRFSVPATKLLTSILVDIITTTGSGVFDEVSYQLRDQFSNVIEEKKWNPHPFNRIEAI